MKELNSCIGAFVLFVGTLVVGALLNGWVLTILWAWFVVPTFHLPQLTIPAAIGLALVAGFLTKQIVDVESPKRTTTETYARTALLTLAPLASLAMGWIVHLFMGAS